MSEFKIKPVFKEFYFPIFVGVFLLIFSPFFLIPKINQIQKAKLDIEDQEKRIGHLTQKLADLQNLSEADLLNTSELLLEALPSQKDFYKMLSLTKKVFADNGTSLKSFDFSPGKMSTVSATAKVNDSGSNQMNIKVTFSSSYDNFGNLLTNFTKILPLLEVDSIKFTSISSTESATLPDLEGTINIRSYFSPLPKVIGKVEDPLPKMSSQGKLLIEELRTYQRYQPEAVAETGESVIVGKENPFP